MTEAAPLMYTDLAPWFHLVTAPEDYALEGEHAIRVLTEAIGDPPATVLELGSGGGNTASHMKAHATLTLTDLSEDMLALSRTLNPGCEHIQGDMRTLRLGRTFDAVFGHDAVTYLTSEDDLRRTFATAWEHLRPGGAVFLEPDHVRETYRDETDHGGWDGGDGDPRSLRYLEWTRDPDPSDTWCITEYAYLLRDGDGGPTRVAHDTHRIGLFPRGTWTELLAEAGFVDIRVIPSPYEDAPGTEGFVGRRPA